MLHPAFTALLEDLHAIDERERERTERARKRERTERKRERAHWTHDERAWFQRPIGA